MLIPNDEIIRNIKRNTIVYTFAQMAQIWKAILHLQTLSEGMIGAVLIFTGKMSVVREHIENNSDPDSYTITSDSQCTTFGLAGNEEVDDLPISATVNADRQS